MRNILLLLVIFAGTPCFAEPAGQAEGPYGPLIVTVEGDDVIKIASPGGGYSPDVAVAVTLSDGTTTAADSIFMSDDGRHIRIGAPVAETQSISLGGYSMEVPK